MGLTCGCESTEGHVPPLVDAELWIEHGERSKLNDDPLPHDVPGTGGWNGLYVESPDTYCLCGHPNYLTCSAESGRLIDLVISRGPEQSS